MDLRFLPNLGIGLSAVLLTILLVTAGYYGFMAEESDPSASGDIGIPASEPTLTSTATATPTPTNAGEGTDLRNISLEQDGGQITRGEIDRDDPQNENGYYEPVQFVAEANTSVNITMGARNGDPQIRLLAPNGSTVDADDNGGFGNSAAIEEATLPQTGRYTLIAGSSEPNTTFGYLLTVEEHTESINESNPANWNKRAKLTEFAYDFRSAANATDNHTQVTNYTVFPKENYISLTYERIPENTTDLQNTQVSVLITYANLGTAYRESSGPFNESFIPDRIFLRAETTDGQLYRTAYLTDEWAKEHERTDDFETYWYKFLYATRWGPAHESYVEGADNSTSVGLAVYDEYNSSAK
ncbi:PPC domain-containing protein [Haloarcula marina]|uniref:PPC domain-containing protein n=1 Tax=Haloarcula marina TaxID=2961574 RepID=UPI0020B8EB34|nr:PPC domain-containing protein [Halomicroarcula marina]